MSFNDMGIVGKEADLRSGSFEIGVDPSCGKMVLLHEDRSKMKLWVWELSGH